MSKVKAISSACLGNLFEHYDTALFGYLSPFLAPLIFPNQTAVHALILTYAIMPISMLARPIGSLFFGSLGDRYGRGEALFFSLVGMGVMALLFALMPTYHQIGWLAPTVFCLGRAVQHFLAAGESMGGAVFLLEHVEKSKHDLFSSLYSATAMGGHLLASFGVFVISYFGATYMGWRFLYVLGSITIIFGFQLRSLSTTRIKKKKQFSWKEIARTLWHYRSACSLIAITSGFARANYYLALVVLNSFIPMVSTMTKTQVMQINTYLLVFDFFALPFFGWLATKLSREVVMVGAALSVCLFASPLLALVPTATVGWIVFVRMVFVMFGVAFFAPYHAWAQQLVPKEARYRVISFGYAIGSQIFGSPAAVLALWFFHKTGKAGSLAWYPIGLAMISGLLIVMRRFSSQRVYS